LHKLTKIKAKADRNRLGLGFYQINLVTANHFQTQIPHPVTQ